MSIAGNLIRHIKRTSLTLSGPPSVCTDLEAFLMMKGCSTLTTGVGGTEYHGAARGIDSVGYLMGKVCSSIRRAGDISAVKET